MRTPLHRFYGQGDLHFITFSCYARRPYLGSSSARQQVSTNPRRSPFPTETPTSRLRSHAGARSPRDQRTANGRSVEVYASAKANSFPPGETAERSTVPKASSANSLG